MKKRILFGMLILSILILASCDALINFSEKMGKNIAGGAVVPEIKVEAKNQSALDLVSNNENLKNVLSTLAGGEENLAKIDLVSPLTDEQKKNLAKSYGSEAGKKALEEMKNKPATLTDEGKKGVDGTVKLINDYIQDVNVEDDGSALSTLVGSLKNSMKELSNGANPTEGEVLALQYTVTLIDDIANSIPNEITITKPKSDGSEVTEEVKVTGEAVVNAILGKNEGNAFALDDMQYLMESDDPGASDAVQNITTSVESYINVVNSVSNFTGGADVGSLLDSMLGKK